MSAHFQFGLRDRLTLAGVGTFLIAAAGLKGFQLSYHGVPTGGILTTVPSYVGLVLAETVLGVWLISGLYERTARRIAILFFAVFMETALWMGLAGQESCGCLGQIRLSPWWVVALDFGILAGLLVVRSPANSRTLQTDPLRFCGVLLLLVTLGLPGIVTMTVYRRETAKNKMNELRHDRILHNAKLNLDLKNPVPVDLLNQLEARLGRRVTVEPALQGTFDASQPNWKTINHRTVRTWAILEAIQRGMPVSTRWLTTEEGYLLINDDPLARARWLWRGAILITVLGLGGICWHHFQRNRAGRTEVRIACQSA